MQQSPPNRRSKVQLAKPQANFSINVPHRTPQNRVPMSRESTSPRNITFIRRIDTSITTPTPRTNKILNFSRVQSTRNNTSNPSLETSFTQQVLTKQPSASLLDTSTDSTKFLHKTRSEKRLAGQHLGQTQLRTRNLREEINAKIQATKDKAKRILGESDQHNRVMSSTKSTEKLRSIREHEIEEKRRRVHEARVRSQENRKKSEERSFQEKQKKVFELKNEKLLNQSIREDRKKEEEIRNCEKIWKVVCHEKKVENNKLYNRIRSRNEISKKFNDKLLMKQNKAEEINNKILELENLESELFSYRKSTSPKHSSVLVRF